MNTLIRMIDPADTPPWRAAIPPVLAALCLLLALPASTRAAPRQSLEAIRQAAEQFIRAQITLTEGEKLKVGIRQLDQRLRLPACPTPLAVSLPPGFSLKSRTSVQVACTGAAEPWKLFVPLQLQKETRAWVAKTALPRQHRLTAGDLQQARVTVPLEETLPNRQQLLGQQLRQAVMPGQALRTRWLEAPVTLRRGERVTLVSGSGRVRVSMAGEVLQDARLGEKVRVRNLSSGKTLEGWLREDGSVQLGGPPPLAQR